MNGESHGHIQAEMAWYNISRIPWESVVGNEWSIPFMWRLYVYLHENHKQNQPDVGKYTIRWIMISIHFSMTYWKFQLNGPSFQPVKNPFLSMKPNGRRKMNLSRITIPMNFWWWLMTLRMSCYNPRYHTWDWYIYHNNDWLVFICFFFKYVYDSKWIYHTFMDGIGYNLVMECLLLILDIIDEPRVCCMIRLQKWS